MNLLEAYRSTIGWGDRSRLVYVPNVSPMPKGEVRRSYIMWHELESPRLLVEYVSGDGSVERDRTPHKGKFWIYERAARDTTT